LRYQTGLAMSEDPAGIRSQQLMQQHSDTSAAREPEAQQRVEGTARIEAFSDGVIAIIITLLIFEVHVPKLGGHSNRAVLTALLGIAPKAASFAVSFLTVAIFWVNHHYIFAEIAHSNWKLLWYNNVLLFWLAIVPFTTAFLGDYPTQPVVVSLYALTLSLAALSFSLLGRYAFFKSGLMAASVLPARLHAEWKRGLWAFILYGIASVLAFVWVYAALVVLLVIPCLFVVPRLLRGKH
jgi:uncharacterized membrane protein